MQSWHSVARGPSRAVFTHLDYAAALSVDRPPHRGILRRKALSRRVTISLSQGAFENAACLVTQSFHWSLRGGVALYLPSEPSER